MFQIILLVTEFLFNRKTTSTISSRPLIFRDTTEDLMLPYHIGSLQCEVPHSLKKQAHHHVTSQLTENEAVKEITAPVGVKHHQEWQINTQMKN